MQEQEWLRAVQGVLWLRCNSRVNSVQMLCRREVGG
jgi:hypothetical protein